MDEYTPTYDTHVFLGPTLHEDVAKTCLSQAYYHPPIKCGDLLRLFRINPKRIVIIDGYYESTPAVWHKEIMLALDYGIEVWGASSMGAIRAAELYQFGMKGVGDIYKDFASGHLNDDDEVAVLHKNQEEAFEPINDAMVDIRATLRKVRHQGVISAQVEEKLLAICKENFYPHRSLRAAIKQISGEFPSESATLNQWLLDHGLILQKREDAIEVLHEVARVIHQDIRTEKQVPITPLTKFIKTLIDYSNVTPFDIEADWLPGIEKKIQYFFKKQPIHARLVASLAVAISNVFFLAPTDESSLDNQALLLYMKEHDLYCPDIDFAYFQDHAILSHLYPYLLQEVCRLNLERKTVDMYLPAAAAFYELTASDNVTPILRMQLVLTLILSAQLNGLRTELKESSIFDSLNKIARKREYSASEIDQWLNPKNVDLDFMSGFIATHLQVEAVYQGMNGLVFECEKKIPSYFNWIHDAFKLYDTVMVTGLTESRCFQHEPA